jgi:hypothetical protein
MIKKFSLLQILNTIWKYHDCFKLQLSLLQQRFVDLKLICPFIFKITEGQTGIGMVVGMTWNLYLWDKVDS